jgi:hypothetical protein
MKFLCCITQFGKDEIFMLYHPVWKILCLRLFWWSFTVPLWLSRDYVDFVFWLSLAVVVWG